MPINKRSVVATIAVALTVSLSMCLLFWFSQVETTRRRTACSDNLRKIGQALQMYVADYDGFLPNEDQWRANTFPSTPRSGCPAAEAIPKLNPPLPDTGEGLPGYAFNLRLETAPHHVVSRLINGQITYAALSHPQTTIAVFDYTSGISVAPTLDIYGNRNGGWPDVLAQGWKRHDSGGNYLFCDGHVGWFTESQILPNLPDICHGDATHPSFCVN